MEDASKEYGLNFSLIATPAEGLSGRFTEIDKKIYGEKARSFRAFFHTILHPQKTACIGWAG